MILDIVGCARCHGDGHRRLDFELLTHPVEAGDLVFTHWAPCPTNGQPILLTIVDRGERVLSPAASTPTVPTRFPR